MVGTRSKVPASAAYASPLLPAPSADSEEDSQDANIDATPTISSPPQPPRPTSLERLPRPVRRGVGGSTTTAATTNTQGKSDVEDLAPAPVVTLRSSSRSTAAAAAAAAAAAVSHTAGRASTRTSLERLPLPPPPAAGSPARGVRGGVGAGENSRSAVATTPPRRSSRGSGGQGGGGAATSRANSELNALLGLDAAVRQTIWTWNAGGTWRGCA